jgi:hypothetical protein
VPFPSPPWSLRAQAWVSVFVLPGALRSDRPAGVYGAAFVDYREGGVLTYHELLVARLLRDGRTPRIRITDIWVDSPESMSGGRALWAIPKQLADLPLAERSTGPVATTTFGAVAGGRSFASGSFTSMPRAALVRTPFRASTSQLREDASAVVAPLAGSARAVPCRGAWTFDPDGPLGFLSGRRPLVSLRLSDTRLRFG